MGSKERREREKEELRSRIMDAARELFAREGYEAVSMRRVAEAIEYSPTAIYLLFKDKESLVRGICNEDFGALAGRFVEIAGVADPIERIRRCGLAYIEFGIKNPNHYRLMFMTPMDDGAGCGPDGSAKSNDPDADGYAFLLDAVNEALAAGRFHRRFKDPTLIAQTFWAAVHGVVSLHITKANQTWIQWSPIESRAGAIVDVTIAGMTAESVDAKVPRRRQSTTAKPVRTKKKARAAK